MKKTLVVIATAAVLGFAVHGWGWCDWESQQRNEILRQQESDLDNIARIDRQRLENEEIKDIMETPSTITREVPVYINEAGDGCHWSEWTGSNGKPHWYACDDGKLHQVYVKVCDDNPKN